MRRYLFILIVFYVQGVQAQQPDTRVVLVHYVLDSFTKGKVQMKSGATHEQKMNYNILTGEMIFETKGTFLAIANPEEVDTVFFGQRKFIPVEGRFYEWLAGSQPALFKEYGCSVKEPTMETGFGSTTTTAAIPLRQLIQSGRAYDLKLPDDYTIIPRNSYWVRKEGRLYKLNNTKTLMNLYPAKMDWIEEWWKRRHGNFSKQEDLIALIAAMH